MAHKDRKNRFERKTNDQQVKSQSGSREKGNNKFPTFQPNSTKNERYQGFNDRNLVTSDDEVMEATETGLMNKSANKLLRMIKTPTR
jgi:hypothetical protein